MAPSGAFSPDLTTESRARRRLPWLGWFAATALAAAIPAAVPAQFTSGVNVVEVYASVTDGKGMPVTGLRREDFIVRENGAAQQISTFAEGQFPLSVAVALDRSFSMAGARLEAARAAARLFLGELRAEDESMLIAVGSATEVLAPLSRDREGQFRALATLDAFGTTGLHDSIVTALEAIQQARGRRALVLLSDGSDRYSRATASDALARARASDVLVYPVALGRDRPALFAELASLTGGRSFHLPDGRRLQETLREIATELRHQYLLGYSPGRPLEPGSNEWRSIKVTVDRPGVTVRARDGYVVK